MGARGLGDAAGGKGPTQDPGASAGPAGCAFDAIVSWTTDATGDGLTVADLRLALDDWVNDEGDPEVLIRLRVGDDQRAVARIVQDARGFSLEADA